MELWDKNIGCLMRARALLLRHPARARVSPLACQLDSKPPPRRVPIHPQRLLQVALRRAPTLRCIVLCVHDVTNLSNFPSTFSASRRRSAARFIGISNAKERERERQRIRAIERVVSPSDRWALWRVNRGRTSRKAENAPVRGGTSAAIKERPSPRFMHVVVLCMDFEPELVHNDPSE
ncbi:hypothetical protein K438DRAFT_1785729 [Mycena galopus ATCC 62051]|nr:hypothetical protein K438DRAFT_1785729 [Mycena galopus ATCC 62051]